MKSFREYLKEDVTPSALVKDGTIDVNNPLVREQINSSLASVLADPAVTPYNALNRISKALAYFHIILPKRIYLDGEKGIEALEIRQFGEKMGMNDQGEFVKEVPGKFFLFIKYGRVSPLNITYAKPTVGGMFAVQARIVDQTDLERLIDMAEISLAEDAACRQNTAKMDAPKEPMHDITSDEKKKGNKEAVADSEKGLDEGWASIGGRYGAYNRFGDVDHKAKFYGGKPKATTTKNDEKDDTYKDSNKNKKVKFAKTVKEENLDEVSLGKLVRYRKGAEQELGDIKHFKKNPGQYPAATSDDIKRAGRSEKTREAGIKLADKKMKGKAKVGASAPKHPYMEETVEEGRMPASVIKHKQRIANMTPEEKAKKFAGKSPEQLKSMARRHGYGKDSTEYSKHVKEEKGDRLTPGFGSRKDFDTVAKEIGTGQGGMTMVSKAPKGGESSSQTIYPMSPKSTSRVAPDDVEKKLDTTTPGNPQAERNRDLQEKLTKKMSAGNVISDFVHSDDPKFKGKSKKERMKMALGAYYGMHPEKSNK